MALFRSHTKCKVIDQIVKKTRTWHYERTRGVVMQHVTIERMTRCH